jgi:translation initiation factor IF-1
MVKNTKGGNKSKGFARKNIIHKESARLRVSEDPLEIYAQVIKMLGGSMCQVISSDGETLLCHIRGKFRGRNKSSNILINGTWVLVGMREWEKETIEGKLKNVDLIEVYSESDKTKLKSNVLDVNWKLFTTNDCKSNLNKSSADTDENIVFADEKTMEFEALVNEQIENKKVTVEEDNLAGEDENWLISIDDI